jgi:hypothetical protein
MEVDDATLLGTGKESTDGEQSRLRCSVIEIDAGCRIVSFRTRMGSCGQVSKFEHLFLNVRALSESGTTEL